MGFGSDVMVDGWIGRRKPSEKVLSELIPYIIHNLSAQNDGQGLKR